MTRPLRGALVVIAVVGALASGGCRGGVAAAPAPADASSPGPAATAGTSDPLGSVESSLDAIEKQVDRDGAG